MGMKVNNQEDCPDVKFNNKGWCEFGVFKGYACACLFYDIRDEDGDRHFLRCPHAYRKYEGG